MKLHSKLDGVGSFNSFTKLYVASKDYKLRNNDALIYFVLARAGFLVHSLSWLNDDSLIANVIYGPGCEVDSLDYFDVAPFKIRRIFKSCVVPNEMSPDGFFRNSAVNFLRLMNEKRGSDAITISVESSKSSYFNLFMKKCCEELDSNPGIYTGMDLSPKAPVEFVIHHSDLPPNRTAIVTWVEGKYWSN